MNFNLEQFLLQTTVSHPTLYALKFDQYSRNKNESDLEFGDVV